MNSRPRDRSTSGSIPGIPASKNERPRSLWGPGSQGSLLVALGYPSRANLPVPRTRGGSPYEDATSMEPCIPSITGPPPSWANPSLAGPSPPSSLGRPSLIGAATPLLEGGRGPLAQQYVG